MPFPTKVTLRRVSITLLRSHGTYCVAQALGRINQVRLT